MNEEFKEKSKKVKKELLILKTLNIKPNYSELSRMYNIDKRTIENLVKELNDAPAEQKSEKIIETIQSIVDENYAEVIKKNKKDLSRGTEENMDCKNELNTRHKNNNLCA